MRMICEKCQTSYTIDESKLQGKVVRVRCHKCNTISTLPRTEVPSTSRKKQHTRDTGSGSEKVTVGGYPTDDLQYALPGWSIKTKITLVLLTLILSSISIVSFIAISRGGSALSTQAENHMLLATQLKADQYNSIFTRLSEEIKGIAHFATLTFEQENFLKDLGFRVLMPWNGKRYGNENDEESLRDERLKLQRIGIALQGLVDNNDFVALGYMASENNVMVFDTEETVHTIEKESEYIPSRRTWYRLAKDAKQTIWSQPYIDVNTKKLVVTCATPVYISGDVLVGVVGVDVLLDTLKNDIISLDIGYGSHAFLIDEKGDILAKQDMKESDSHWNQNIQSENILQSGNVEFGNIARKMMQGETGIVTYNEENTSFLFSFAPLPAINSSVGIQVSEKEVIRPATLIRQQLLIVWIAVIVVSLVAGLAIGNTITQPIKELTIWADGISQGATELEEMESSRRDEIGVLIASFNRLVASLKIAIARRAKKDN